MKTYSTVPGDDDVYIVAEIGKNFIQSEEDRPVEEYIQNAIALIDAAVECKVDAVKFQTHTVDDEQLPLDITSPHFSGSDRYSWVKRNTEATPLQFWDAIVEHCSKRDITFFTTPMSRGAARKMAHYDLPFWKVGSGDVFDYVLLEELVSLRKSIIISSGMVSLEELDSVVQYLQQSPCPLVLLYCISKYPCPPEDFNLSTISNFIDKYPGVTIGFSDHSIGHDAALAAMHLGARVIEKHFSLSRDLWGSDHKVSMTLDEMQHLVAATRAREYDNVDPTVFLGQKDRELEGADNQFRPYFHKTVVAGASLAEGTVLEKDMIFAMRPAALSDGLPSEEYPSIVGKTLSVDVDKYTPLRADMFV